MPAQVDIQQFKDKLEITIKGNQKPVMVVGFIVMAATYLAIAIFFLYLIWDSLKHEMYILTIFLLVTTYVYYLAGKNLIKGVRLLEKIVVTRNELIFNGKLNIYLSEIKAIRYFGDHEYTKHPLEGESVDIMGFGMTDKVIQHVGSDGSLEIFYNEEARKFGKDVDLEDSEKIIKSIEDFTGKEFGNEKIGYDFTDEDFEIQDEFDEKDNSEEEN